MTKTVKIAIVALMAAISVMATETAQAQDACTVGPNSGAYLGINGQPAQVNGVRGVRVVSDQMQRPLTKYDFYGNPQTVYFRTGYDIITNINGRPVYTPADVLSALNYGTNYLQVYDSYTGSQESVQVEIAGNPTPCQE